MSYQALYRKYRPSTLEDVIGQDIVIRILKNAIMNDKVCHAYLFSGPRGIGKTTIAKLLAKTINCLDIHDGDACEKCDNCVSINQGFNADIIEIDAASNNGVDEIREIKNKINLVPNQLKYKVYIIDEVHMLSIGAFNALLKTLEEPPEHIIFILATTDLHKVPSTIVSRCQCFEFHRICNEDIVKRLEYICKKEKITVDKKVLENIARLSDGGLRDAVGMLDKLNAYSNSKISIEDFEKVNGIVSIDDQKQFLNYVYDKDILNIIEFIDDIYDKGKDLIIFTQDIIELCKEQCISHYVNNKCDYDIQFLLEFSSMISNLLKNINFSSNTKTILEINILSFVNSYGVEKQVIEKSSEKIPKKDNDSIDNKQKTKEEDNKNISREIISNNEVEEIEQKFLKLNQQIINNCFARANKKEKQNFESKWDKLNDYALDSEYGAVACYLSDGGICAVGEGEVIISFDYESMVNRGIHLIDKIEILLEKIYEKHYDVALLTNDEWKKEKEKFISNKNNKIQYEYQPISKDTSDEKEKKKDLTKNSVTSSAIELFGEDIISVN